MARSVNFVWNYINELSSRLIKQRVKLLPAYDLHPYTKGASKELGLQSDSAMCCGRVRQPQKAIQKSRLKWRKSIKSFMRSYRKPTE